jgi:hypothetical protein
MKQLQQGRETDNRAKTSHRRKEEESPEEMEGGYKKKENGKLKNKFNRITTLRGWEDSLYSSHILQFYSLFSHHSFLSVLSNLLPIPKFQNSHFGTDLNNTDRFFKILRLSLLKIPRMI